MIRVISISLVLAAGAATAGEPMDCYNDDFDGGTRYTSTEAEVLRVTDADISAMLIRIRENENRSGDPALHISLISETPASD
jgi:hypothetical protein